MLKRTHRVVFISRIRLIKSDLKFDVLFNDVLSIIGLVVFFLLIFCKDSANETQYKIIAVSLIQIKRGRLFAKYPLLTTIST